MRVETLTYPTTGIHNLVSSDVVTDGTSTVGSTTYAYDETLGTGHAALLTTTVPGHFNPSSQRGNLTTVTQSASPSSTLITTTAYEDTGNPVSVTAPSGTSTYAYDGPTHAFIYTATPPTPSSGVSLPFTATYDANSGVPLTATDPNGQTVTYVSYDPLLRPTEIDYPDGGKMVASYTPTQTGVYNYMTGITHTNTQTNYGMYGRLNYVAIQNASGGYYWTNYCYDSNGGLQLAAYRFTGGSISCSNVGDTYTYDGLGRATRITHGDGSTTNYTYSGRATQVTDENGVSRIVQTDGLGRPTAVCEISGTTLQGVAPAACGLDIAGSGFLTTYAYSTDTASGNAQRTAVTQGAQTRTFETDWLGRSTSVTEPESGKTTYSYAYNSIGLIVTRHRPTANQTSASTLTTTTTQYDSLGRVVNVSYSDGTPAKQYLYDANGGFAAPQSNLKGRLSRAQASTSPTFSGTVFSYDAVGRIIALSECLPGTCGTPADDKNLAYTYDLAGDLTSSTDGAGATTTYTYSIAGEVKSITSNASSLSSATVPGTIVSGVQNGPFGPVSYTLGNGVSQFNSYDILGRLNGGSVCPVGTTPALGCSGKIYGFTATWKGQRLNSSSDSVEGTGITYGYDSFNRLSSLTNSSSQSLYTYGYDRYGNRWSQQPGSGVSSGSTFNVAYNAGTNQITGTGYTYDAAGNLMSDGTNSYTYDADGNLTGLVSGGVTQQLTYNGLNQQVAQSFSSSTGQDESLVVFDQSGNLASLWLAGSGQLLGKAYWGSAAIESYNPANNTALFAHRDWVGTRRAVTGETGGTNAIVSSLPFGDDTTNVSGGPGNTFDGFTGLWASGTPTTDHAQFREYSNIAGRWVQPDPYAGSYDATNPQSFNRYAYVLNNPMTFVDPSGLIRPGPPTFTPLPPPDDVGHKPMRPVSGNEPRPAGGAGGGGRGPSDPNNGCGTSGFGGGLLIGYGGSFDAGLGATGVTGTGSVAGGLFYGSGNGFSAGALASGGTAAYALGNAAGAPTQTGQPFSLGAYAGAGPNITVTNARSVQQLGGPFTTLTLNVGVGPVKGSVQLSFANGIFELSVGPPIPVVAPGIGLSVSKVVTNTVTTKTGCGG